MEQFSCEKTREVYETRFAADIPDHVSIPAHEKMRVLVAAHSLQDVRVLGPILRWPNLPKRYGLIIHGKWNVTFAWSDDFGAHEIMLERR